MQCGEGECAFGDGDGEDEGLLIEGLEVRGAEFLSHGKLARLRNETIECGGLRSL